jgi:hypothetical protein
VALAAAARITGQIRTGIATMTVMGMKLSSVLVRLVEPDRSGHPASRDASGMPDT